MPQSKTPHLRFKGFLGEWEERELIHYSSRIGDGLHGTPDYVNGTGIYFINGNNLNLGSICITNETREVSKKDYIKNDKALTLDTILMSINGTIGNMAWYQGEPVMLGKSVAYISLRDCDNAYMYSYLQTTKISNYFFNNLTGSTIKNLGLKIIRETKISIPANQEEQTKIGDYFQRLDTLIEQKKKKYQKLKQFKTAMLSQMFPKEGERTPELRFKGFSGEWINQKFGECVLIQRGGSPRPIEKFITNDENGINWIKIGDVSTGSRYITKTKEKIISEGEKHSRRVQKGDLILSNSMSFGRPYIMAIDGCIHDGWLLIRDDKKMFALEYLLQLLSSDHMISQYKALASGGVVINLNSELVQSTNIFIPDLEEQTKIGNYFQKLDTLIDLHQKELEKLKNMKKALLAKMFV